MITSGPIFENKLMQVNHMVDLLQHFDQPCRIIMSGNGDPLASAIMRPLIHRYRPKPNHSVRLFTNGLLLKKQLADSSILPHVDEYSISIDAGSGPVYERVRLGGSWNKLLENFDWLRDQVRRQRARVLLMMVVQRENYKDLANFCDLVISYGFTGSVTYLEDWGTWRDFASQDVIGNSNHPEHQAAKNILASVYQQYHYQPISFGSKLLKVLHLL
jgi:MoaA/NifB/PqqE/SkfB family radical SAM enzyme